MSDRPGSQEARCLYRSPVDVSEWKHSLNCYDIAVACVANGKSKSDLVRWDAYLWKQLVTDVNARTPKHITLPELADVMRWKLARGKARPLQKLVESNANSAVVKASTDAFKLLESGKWEKAIDTIAALKGIGVATATAIFAPFDPSVPFMADETMEAAISKRDYTMKVYRELRDALITKADEIRSMDESGEWNAEKVGKALWVKAMMYVYPGIEDQASKDGNDKVSTAASKPLTGTSVEKLEHIEKSGKAIKRKSDVDDSVETPSRSSTLFSEEDNGKSNSAGKKVKR